jgi:hypothetical protein
MVKKRHLTYIIWRPVILVRNIINELENKYKHGTDMLLWIDDREPNTWCRSLFGKPRYGVTTSSTVEVVFNTLNKVRGYSYLESLMYIEKYVLKNMKLSNEQ